MYFFCIPSLKWKKGFLRILVTGHEKNPLFFHCIDILYYSEFYKKIIFPFYSVNLRFDTVIYSQQKKTGFTVNPNGNYKAIILSSMKFVLLLSVYLQQMIKIIKREKITMWWIIMERIPTSNTRKLK